MFQGFAVEFVTVLLISQSLARLAKQAKESLHPWVNVDQAGRPLPPKPFSILEGLMLNLDQTLSGSLRN